MTEIHTVDVNWYNLFGKLLSNIYWFKIHILNGLAVLFLDIYSAEVYVCACVCIWRNIFLFFSFHLMTPLSIAQSGDYADTH